METLAYVLAHSSEIENVIYEPISNEKSKRILHSDLLSRLTILKPNLIQLKDLAEAVAPGTFTTFSVHSDTLDQDRLVAINSMIDTLFAHARKVSAGSRLEIILVTLGAHGVLVASKEGSHRTRVPALPVDPKLVKSVVGAGDSFMGGYIYGLYHGKSVDECVEYGQRCAVASMLSERHVGEQVSEAWIKK